MSDRLCNRCTFDRRAREEKLEVRPRPVSGFPDGVEVLDEQGNVVCWYGELPDKCAC